MQFAKRTNWSLEDNTIIKTFQKLKAESSTLLNLIESNPTQCGFQYPDELLGALTNTDSLVYQPQSQGLQKTREIVAAYYQKQNIDVSPGQIFLTSSTSEAYSYLFRILADVGQEILFPQPSYPLFQFLVDLNDLRMIPYSLTYDDRWNINGDQFDVLVSTETKALVLVNPNNPTGSYISPDEARTLNSLCNKYDMALICDEVFYDFTLDVDERVSMAGNKDVLTFTLSGLSKIMGLPQMKLSWIVVSGPDDVVKEAIARLDVVADTYLSVNAPVQNAFPVWFENIAVIQKQIQQRIVQNYQLIKDGFHRYHPNAVLKSEGGWYAVVRLDDRYTEEEWVLKFLNECHVFVHPGYFFDLDEGTYIVLSLLPQSNHIEEGLRRILPSLG